MSLTAEGCRARQQRLAALLHRRGLDAALVSQREHVYYLGGLLHNVHHAAALLLTADGRATLVSADPPPVPAVDAHIPYDAAFLATMHSRQHAAVAEALKPELTPGTYGADLSGGIGCIAALGGTDVVDLTPDMFALRKNKHDDELACIRECIRLTEVMYTTAQQVIAPGVDEVTVFSKILAATTRAAGEFLEEMGNDFRANALGGKPRRRLMNAGELYILDAGPRLHGYHADNCRTFAVDGSPTDAQLKVWERIDSLFPILEAMIRPGLRAVELFDTANEYLTWEGFDGMIHHLGHGIGLRPHEAPELNPNYDAVLEAGDVITMEPGLYSDELKAGIRLEENYLVTAHGPEKLTRFPRSLTGTPIR